MKDSWDKLKVVSDVVKDNKLLIVACFTGLGSMVTNGVQLVTNQDLEQEKITAVHEVAKGFQSVMVDLEPKPKKVSSNCNKCLIEVRKLRSEFHD